ncbi:histidine decarboxylase [Nocardia sp. NPDC003482]
MLHLPDDADVRIPDEPAGTPAGSERDAIMITELAAGMLAERDRMLGFPVNLDFDYEPFARLLSVHGNNVGSPGKASEYSLHTKPFERAVIEFFARLAGAPDAFGYLTSGGTEANLFGCYLGRERFPDSILYASEAAHYSISKIGRLLRMKTVLIPVGAEQAMDTEKFAESLAENSGRAAVVLATVGTTTGGAFDDIPGIRAALRDSGTKDFHIHSDAAFGGLLAALGPRRRPWAFESGADSLAISGHKMIGGPLPSGVVLAHRSDVEAIRNTGVAVGSDDDTITGSRDALTPLLLWYELRRLGVSGLRQRVRRCLEVAEYAERRLRAEGRNPQRLSDSNTVLFDAPEQHIAERWNLMISDGRAHLITMPHITEAQIDRLCADLR